MNMPEEWPPYPLDPDERKALVRQREAMSESAIAQARARDAVRFGDRCDDPLWQEANAWLTSIAGQHGLPIDVVREGELLASGAYWARRSLENRVRSNRVPLEKCQAYLRSVREFERSLDGLKARIDALPAAPAFNFPAIEEGLRECKAAWKCASYDQRTVLAVGARTDLRVAAAALIQTVAEHAEKSGRKVRTNLNEFLFQALWLIDRSVTYRLVEDLDRSAFVVMIDRRPDVSAA